VARVESVWWDLDDEPEGNVRHIAEHGLTKEEVEEVLGNPANLTDESQSSGRPATFGWTATGKPRHLGGSARRSADGIPGDCL
jgi:hypothetical protein